MLMLPLCLVNVPPVGLPMCCSIRFYTQEIVVFRGDSYSRVRRHALIPSSDADAPLRQLITTLLDQAHLCPLPMTTQPVYWDFDHALRLYPLPNVVRTGRVACWLSCFCDDCVGPSAGPSAIVSPPSI